MLLVGAGLVVALPLRRAVLAGLLTALVQAHMTVGRPSLAESGRVALRLILFGAPVMAALFLFLGFTRTGKTMRAVADNPVLAGIKGINADRVAWLANGVGMGLAGIGGMLIGLDTSIDPLTGSTRATNGRSWRSTSTFTV